MEKKHDFILNSQHRVDNLTDLLAKSLPGLGLTLVGKGALREIEGQDYSLNDILLGYRTIGSYNFDRLEGNIYSVSLDLLGLPEDIYENLARIIGPTYPEAKLPVYTG